MTLTADELSELYLWAYEEIGHKLRSEPGRSPPLWMCEAIMHLIVGQSLFAMDRVRQHSPKSLAAQYGVDAMNVNAGPVNANSGGPGVDQDPKSNGP